MPLKHVTVTAKKRSQLLQILVYDVHGVFQHSSTASQRHQGENLAGSGRADGEVVFEAAHHIIEALVPGAQPAEAQPRHGERLGHAKQRDAVVIHTARRGIGRCSVVVCQTEIEILVRLLSLMYRQGAVGNIKIVLYSASIEMDE